jgi:hypothetical protein
MHALLPLLLALTLQKTPAPDTVWSDAVVAKRYPAKVYCGYAKSWGAVDFTHDGMTDRVYVMCARAGDLGGGLPRVGAHCSVSSHTGSIDEISSDERQTPFEGKVVISMTCNPPVGVEQHLFRAATITSYGKTPQVDSGSIFVSVRRVTVTTAEGATRTLYFFHGHGNEFLNHAGWDTYPAIGSVCDFSTVTHDFRHGNFLRERDGDDSPEGEVIENATCKR